jgi:hypothetical protein
MGLFHMGLQASWQARRLGRGTSAVYTTLLAPGTSKETRHWCRPYDLNFSGDLLAEVYTCRIAWDKRPQRQSSDKTTSNSRHFSFPIPVMQPFSRWLSLENGLVVL